ncbi:hypothetical protein PR048_020181 [Dryococelus australis]|uniref:Uncharacterized protein n=1 Tax=Dryococelus australis TaxID=614101 RepID=A0ABQ9H5K2_9NEOP|nr:hypothetical protein PR048_020181 [Dryococelus australis]
MFDADKIEEWMCSHPGRAGTQMKVAGLFGAALKRVATVGRAAAAFCGTEPAEDANGQNEGKPVEELEDKRTNDEVQIPENTEESQVEVISIAGTSSGPTVSVTEIYALPKDQNGNQKEKN